VSGARILAGVLVLAALLLWTALAGGSDADLERGLAATEAAFDSVEAELAALDGDYQALRTQGLVLGLREQHDELRNHLAELKSRRVALANDTTLDRRRRLPELQKLAEEADAVLALAIGLRRECAALVAFRGELQPLLAEAQRQRAELAQRAEADPERRARIATLATSLAEAEKRIDIVERLLRDNVDQGVSMGESVLATIRTLVDEQGRLLRP
jgi:chromosome segregation ATPase